MFGGCNETKCLDRSNISDSYICTEKYQLFCDCDGLKYDNEWYAENLCVTEWTEGEYD